MISINTYIKQSLSLHLFFARIMKEHAFFLETGFTGKDQQLASQADMFRRTFDSFLNDVVVLSNGVVSPEVLASEEIVTPFTLHAEQTSAYFTGVQIQTDITEAESRLTGGDAAVSPSLEQYVYNLNENAKELIDDLIRFKTKLLSDVLACKLATFIYPLMIDHMLREAKLYQSMLQKLQSRADINIEQEIFEQESYWNRIMGEHSTFYRGLFDPIENDLIISANQFSNQFDQLEAEATQAAGGAVPLSRLTADSLSAANDFRDFNAARVQGILYCQIKSLILPLLADHLLRESNHYLRLLHQFS